MTNLILFPQSKKKRNHRADSQDPAGKSSDKKSVSESRDNGGSTKKSRGSGDDGATKKGEEKKSDETLMDLLAKMSEAYMKTKQQNNELTHR